MALKIGMRFAVFTHNILRRLLSFFDYLLWSFFDSESGKKIKTEKIKKILVLLINQEKGNVGGDFITLGVLNAFKKDNPGSKLWLLSDESTLKNFGRLRDIKVIKFKEGFNPDSLKKESFDALLFLNPGRFMIDDFYFIPYRIGFTNLSLKGFFTRQKILGYTRKIHNRISEHMVDMRFRMFEALGFKFREKKPFLEFTKEESEGAESFIKKNKLDEFIILHPGGKYVAEFYKKGKRAPHLWNLERYAEVADYFIERGYKIIITGTRDEQILFDEIRKHSKYKEQIISACGRLSIKEVGCLLKKSVLLIATDTSIIHLAYQDPINAKIVELMGPSIPEIAGAWPLNSDRNIILVDRGPAYKSMRKLPLKDNFNCLKNIKSSQVIKAAEELIRRHPAGN